MTTKEQKAAEKWWGKRMWEIAGADCDIHTEDLNDAFLAGDKNGYARAKKEMS